MTAAPILVNAPGTTISRIPVSAGTVLAALAMCACHSTTEAPAAPAATAQQTPQAATKLGGFTPAAGTVNTLGYDELGKVDGISVEVREMQDSKGESAMGLLVEIREDQYRTERAFVDSDEITELLKGIDALLAVNSNPTSFKNFEVRYMTRDSLEFTAFNTSDGAISYVVQVGRVAGAKQFVDGAAIQKLREMFVAAQSKITALTGSPG